MDGGATTIGDTTVTEIMIAIIIATIETAIGIATIGTVIATATTETKFSQHLLRSVRIVPGASYLMATQSTSMP
jgi:hypothetical protein